MIPCEIIKKTLFKIDFSYANFEAEWQLDLTASEGKPQFFQWEFSVP
jgi:hypothetical protein